MISIERAPMTEKEFDALIRSLAMRTGWQVYHTYRSTRSAPGWPDLAMARPPRLLLIELKTDAGRLTPEQSRWIDLLGKCESLEVDVWRPHQIPEIARTLSPRSKNGPPTGEVP